jgi:hypothetical protein
MTITIWREFGSWSAASGRVIGLIGQWMLTAVLVVIWRLQRNFVPRLSMILTMSQRWGIMVSHLGFLADEPMP